MYEYSNIFIKNIYHMLTYVFKPLEKLDDRKMNIEESDNIHNLLAAILSVGISAQLKQGLYREYITKCEDLSVIRGKIDMQGTIRNRIGHKIKVSCEFDELSENNIFNQILKTTVMFLLKSEYVKDNVKSELRKEMLYFSNIDVILPSNIKWQTLRFQRNNQLYRTLITICQLIIDGMLLTTEEGEYELADFVDNQNMCALYERFILEYYRKHHSYLSAKASQIPWDVEEDEGLAVILPKMETDITLSKGNRVLIIDAKFYTHNTQVQFNKHTVHSGNLYQIFTYVKNKQYKLESKNIDAEVSGMLLYAKTLDEIQPDGRCKIHGNSIAVRNLDLGQEFYKVKEQLDNIVKDYFNV